MDDFDPGLVEGLRDALAALLSDLPEVDSPSDLDSDTITLRIGEPGADAAAFDGRLPDDPASVDPFLERLEEHPTAGHDASPAVLVLPSPFDG